MLIICLSGQIPSSFSNFTCSDDSNFASKDPSSVYSGSPHRRVPPSWNPTSLLQGLPQSALSRRVSFFLFSSFFSRCLLEGFSLSASPFSPFQTKSLLICRQLVARQSSLVSSPPEVSLVVCNPKLLQPLSPFETLFPSASLGPSPAQVSEERFFPPWVFFLCFGLRSPFNVAASQASFRYLKIGEKRVLLHCLSHAGRSRVQKSLFAVQCHRSNPIFLTAAFSTMRYWPK